MILSEIPKLKDVISTASCDLNGNFGAEVINLRKSGNLWLKVLGKPQATRKEAQRDRRIVKIGVRAMLQAMRDAVKEANNATL